MKRVPLAFALGLTAILLTGCCTPARQYVKVADIRGVPDPVMARVFVGGWKHIDKGWIPVIRDNGREIGTFADTLMGSYLCWDRLPGRAVISADVQGGLRESKLVLNAEAGQTYWLWADFPGFKDKLELIILPPKQRNVGPMVPPLYLPEVAGTSGGAEPTAAVPTVEPAAFSEEGL
jgi:hypothetical protein